MIAWLHHHPSIDAPEFRLGREGETFIAEWIGIGTLRASARGETSAFVPAETATPEDVARVVDGTAGAFLRHLRGELTIHGSCVAFRAGEAWRGVALLGSSGAGKSTLAAQLCARSDAALVADDLLHLELRERGAWVTPSARSNRLLGDARRALGMRVDEADDAHKVDVSAAAACLDVSIVGAIVQLVFDESIRRPALAPLQGAKSFRALTESLFRFALDEPNVQKRDLDRLADVAAAAPLYELRRPRGIEHFAGARDLVRSLIVEVAP